MKQYLLSLFVLATSLVACTDDYTDWATPQSNPQKDAVAFGNGSVAPVEVINLADVTTEKVKVANITAPTSSDSTYTPSYKLNLGSSTFDIDAEGNMLTEELTNYINTQYGKRPVEHDMDATISAWIGNGATAIKMATSATFQIKAIPEAPAIDAGYYLVGDMLTNGEISGWTPEGMQAFSHSGKDVYEDPVFTIIITTTADNQYWKIIPKSNADAGNILADGVIGTKVNGDDSAEGSLTNTDAQAGKIAKAGMYIMTINMMDYTYTIKEPTVYETVGLIGVGGDWNNDIDMQLVTPHNWYIARVDIPAGEIKIRANHTWGEGNWGYGDGDFVSEGTLVNGSNNNIKIPGGKYNVSFNDVTCAYKFEPAE